MILVRKTKANREVRTRLKRQLGINAAVRTTVGVPIRTRCIVPVSSFDEAIAPAFSPCNPAWAGSWDETAVPTFSTGDESNDDPCCCWDTGVVYISPNGGVCTFCDTTLGKTFSNIPFLHFSLLHMR